jgi:uncharacterized RmlC-like cupin family protein
MFSASRRQSRRKVAANSFMACLPWCRELKRTAACPQAPAVVFSIIKGAIVQANLNVRVKVSRRRAYAGTAEVRKMPLRGVDVQVICMSITLNVLSRTVCSSVVWWLLFGGLTEADEHQHKHRDASELIDEQATVITVRPARDVISKQGLPQFVGISGATAGAKGLSMNLVVIPPAGAAEPHVHKGYESAVFLIEGRVETRYGAGLKKSVINKAGEFLFIPPNVPHQPVNLSNTKPARAIVSRNDPNEQEHVVPYNPATDK